MQAENDQQTGTEAKTQLVELVNGCLRSGQYSRALDLLRAAGAEFPNDAELSDLEKLAHDGVNRNAEAQRLITESQELFAQRKSAEAIQLLRKAHELDKKNSLARSILANALVEHAQSIVETDWLEAEKLANQALNLNPAHPTAKRILNQIVGKKETSPVSEWVAQARKLQSSGDLFAALAWVAEGLAVHPHEPRLLQIQDEIQRDQDARRRQARRGDLEDLRRMQKEIEATTDVAAKQALAERIQGVAAKYWTDGEILSIANALLLRLGLVTQESSGGAPRGKGSTLILHVPRPNAPKTAPAEPARIAPSPIQQSEDLPSPAPSTSIATDPISTSSPPAIQAAPIAIADPPTPVFPAPVPPIPVSSESVPAVTAPANSVPLTRVPPRMAPRGKRGKSAPKPQTRALEAATVAASELFIPPARISSPSSQQKQPAGSKAAVLVLVSAVVIVLVGATFYFTRRHYATPTAKTVEPAPVATVPVTSAPAVSAPAAVQPVAPVPVPLPSQTNSEPSPPASSPATETTNGKVAQVDHSLDAHPANTPPPAAESVRAGSLLVVAGQDGARVFLDGKLQPQLTQAGLLRLPNLELKDHVVQISKSGFQDPAPQKVRIRKGEQAKLVFNLQPQPQPQPQPRLASLAVQGGSPGTTVLVDQTAIGTIQPDGTLFVSSINPGDHTVELRKERFKPRQLKEHFVAGGAVSLTASDTLLEAAPAELRVTYTPADASVAISKGDLPKVISSGVPISVVPGTYTLTARTADRITRVATFEVAAGQSKNLDLSLAPNGMSKWDNPGAWKQEGDSFSRKGGDFVLYGVAPAAGTFSFSAMATKGHLVQWVLNYTDARNYVLCQIDETTFYRVVIRNGQRTDEIKVPDKGDKKNFRTLQIRVSATEIVHVIKHGDRWSVLDRWTQPGANLSQGKFGFYIPGDDQVALSNFSHYADLNIR